MDRILYAARKLADYLRLLSIAGTGGVYVASKDALIGAGNASVLAALFGVACIVVAFLIDLLTGDKDD